MTTNNHPAHGPVLPDIDTIALNAARNIMCDINRMEGWPGGDIQLLASIQSRIEQTCRSAMLQAGNSPVTPDCWIPVSERMPADGDIVLVVDDGCFVCEAQHRSGNFYSTARGGDDFFETECRDVAHWMPLPAAPQQEVK